MKKIYLPTLSLAATLLLAACSSTPTAKNYNDHMNVPEVKAGNTAQIDTQLANKTAWNQVAVTQMSMLHTLPDGSYSSDNTQGVLTVRASLVNEGTTPVQGNWRCKFYDSNNLPLYEDENSQLAKASDGLGWHQNMILYPVTSKSQTHDANVISCKAKDTLATNYRVEFHDTSNDITVYKR